MVKVKLIEILNVSGIKNQGTPEQEDVGLGRIMKMKLPAKVSYRFTKLLTEVAKRKESFQKVQIGLFEKYGEKIFDNELDKDSKIVLDENDNPKRKDTGQMRLLPENIEKFNKELNELLTEEEEINYLPVTVQMLEEGKVEIEGNDMIMLMPFILDEDEVGR